MQDLSALRALSLSYNPMGKRGLRALASALKTSGCPLEELHLASIKSSNGGGISDALSVFVEQPSQPLADNLRVVDLSGNGIDNSGCAQLAKWLANCGRLEVLDLSHSSFTSKGVSNLQQALSGTRQLRALNLGHNDIGNNGVKEALVVIEAKCESLELLDFEAVGMTGNSMADLSAKLKKVTNLRVLKLGWNSLTDLSVPPLANSLRGATALEELHVPSSGIEWSGVRELVPVVQSMSSLRVLDVRCNAPGAGGNALLAKLVQVRPELDVRQW